LGYPVWPFLPTWQEMILSGHSEAPEKVLSELLEAGFGYIRGRQPEAGYRDEGDRWPNQAFRKAIEEALKIKSAHTQKRGWNLTIGQTGS